MKLDVVSETENKLLKRKELTIRLANKDATVSKQELVKALSEKLKEKPENMVVDKIVQPFGKKECAAFVRVYSDRKTMEEIEPKHLLKRLEKKEEKKQEGAEEGQQPEGEKPAEEKQAEAKPSEKPEKKEAEAAEKPAEEKKVEEAAKEEKTE